MVNTIDKVLFSKIHKNIIQIGSYAKGFCKEWIKACKDLWSVPGTYQIFYNSLYIITSMKTKGVILIP